MCRAIAGPARAAGSRAGPRRSGRARRCWRIPRAATPQRRPPRRPACACARSPVTKPASTSPEPAVASHGGALSLMAARPSGAAITVSGPLSTTTAPLVSAALSRTLQLRAGNLAEQALELALVRGQHHRRAARLDGLEQRLLRRLGLGAAHDEARARGLHRSLAFAPARTRSAHRHRARRRPCEASTVSTLAAVAAPTPAPGPISTALRRCVRQELGKRCVRGDRAHHDRGRSAWH